MILMSLLLLSQATLAGSEVDRAYEETYSKLRDATDSKSAPELEEAARSGATRIGKAQDAARVEEQAKQDRKSHGIEEPTQLVEAPVVAENPPVPAEITFEPARRPAASAKALSKKR